MAHDDPFAGKRVNADWAFYLDTQGSYTPGLFAATTDPTLGTDSSQIGWWQRNGHWISGEARILFGTSGVDPGSGAYRVEIPFAYDASLVLTTGGIGASVVGAGVIRDDSATGNSRPVVAILGDHSGTPIVTMMVTGQSNIVNDSTPFIWAANDRITVQFAYPADPAVLPS